MTERTAADLFDEHAANYAATLKAATRSSGESIEFFALQKACQMRDALGPSAKPASILDFGCGVGLSTQAIASTFPGCGRVVGCDPSSESIAHAAVERGSDVVQFVAFDESGRLPFDDGSFSVISAACVFHHIDRGAHGRWLEELRRVLRPGGQLFIFEHNPANPLTRKSVRDCPFDEGVILLAPWYARRIIERSGFQRARVRFYFFFPRVLAALRFSERFLGWCPIGAQYFVRAEKAR